VVLLEMFASEILEDVSLNQWLRRTPAEIVQAHLGFDRASLEQIPSKKLKVV
jgi:oxalate decarboxylase/phosphoglucose isomerase-like protein (cupin superfamily)